MRFHSNGLDLNMHPISACMLSLTWAAAAMGSIQTQALSLSVAEARPPLNHITCMHRVPPHWIMQSPKRVNIINACERFCCGMLVWHVQRASRHKYRYMHRIAHTHIHITRGMRSLSLAMRAALACNIVDYVNWPRAYMYARNDASMCACTLCTQMICVVAAHISQKSEINN